MNVCRATTPAPQYSNHCGATYPATSAVAEPLAESRAMDGYWTLSQPSLWWVPRQPLPSDRLNAYMEQRASRSNGSTPKQPPPPPPARDVAPLPPRSWRGDFPRPPPYPPPVSLFPRATSRSRSRSATADDDPYTYTYTKTPTVLADDDHDERAPSCAPTVEESEKAGRRSSGGPSQQWRLNTS
jgi:hypothetical protein